MSWLVASPLGYLAGVSHTEAPLQPRTRTPPTILQATSKFRQATCHPQVSVASGSLTSPPDSNLLQVVATTWNDGFHQELSWYAAKTNQQSINRTSKKLGFLGSLRAARSGAGYVKR